MARYFDTISKEDRQTLKDAFVSITLLIASAEEELNDAEIAEAINTIKVRGYEANHLFHNFYTEIGLDFGEKLMEARTKYTINHDSEDMFANQVSQVNRILDQLPNSVAKRLYKDYLSFAHRIANSSGGILGFATITREERNLINLPMIHPVVDEEEE